MSTGYQAVQWSPYKRRYDLVMVSGILSFLLVFVIVGKLIWRGSQSISNEILVIRALGTCALVMLSFTLMIGPLARINRRFLPILYNRRHLGVATFCVAMLHVILVVGYYHGFGSISPAISLLESNVQYRSLSAFPFEIMGLGALLILSVMASTSHDFWLKNLSPATWKTLHMLVYLAFALVVLHVALGSLQSETNPVYWLGLLSMVLGVSSLHLWAGWRQQANDPLDAPDAWVDVCEANEIPDLRARVVRIAGQERIAIFRTGNKLSAISNVCAHQAGPLGEGKIIRGCVTCPWHGYQYRPEDGCAPPPFTEKLPTYRLRVIGGRVQVNPEPLPPAHPFRQQRSRRWPMPDARDEFFVGYLPTPPQTRMFLRRWIWGMCVMLVLIAGLGAILQRSPGDGQWDLDHPASLQGVVRLDPYPMLQTSDHTWVLVRQEKFGAGNILNQYDGQSVKLSGHRIQRGNLSLLELAPEKFVVPGDDQGDLKSASLSPAMPISLRGEIIDPKCYCGTMKPGDGKPHKACAVLCIRGGIPPAFVSEQGTIYLVTGAGGMPLTRDELDALIPFVADPVQLRGEVQSLGDLHLLTIDPTSIKRL